MNEIALIRAQLAGEKARLIGVAEACLMAMEHAASAPQSVEVEAFRSACVDYLARGLAAFEERDQRLADLVRARPDIDPAFARVLDQAGRGREVLERLERAGNGPLGEVQLTAWRAGVQYLAGVWGARRDALDALLAGHPRVSDWRGIGAIDADWIVAERSGYARVRSLLPPGSLLPPAGAL